MSVMYTTATYMHIFFGGEIYAEIKTALYKTVPWHFLMIYYTKNRQILASSRCPGQIG